MRYLIVMLTLFNSYVKIVNHFSPPKYHISIKFFTIIALVAFQSIGLLGELPYLVKKKCFS